MVYINMNKGKNCETVDHFDTYKEAKDMLKEYQISDSYNNYYISSRACKAWKEGQK